MILTKTMYLPEENIQTTSLQFLVLSKKLYPFLPPPNYADRQFDYPERSDGKAVPYCLMLRLPINGPAQPNFADTNIL